MLENPENSVRDRFKLCFSLIPDSADVLKNTLRRKRAVKIVSRRSSKDFCDF